MKKQLRIKLFNAVRDLPYRIAGQERDSSCVAKTKLLGELFTRLGLFCKVTVCDVMWSDTGIPLKLLAKAPRPTFQHYFLQIFIPETKTWVNVDAAWDSLMNKRFPVNIWDGLSNTRLAYEGTNLRKALDEQGNPLTPWSMRFRNFDPTDEFTKELNKWYSRNRRKEKP